MRERERDGWTCTCGASNAPTWRFCEACSLRRSTSSSTTRAPAAAAAAPEHTIEVASEEFVKAELAKIRAILDGKLGPPSTR